MQKKPKKPIIFWYLINMAVVFLFNLFVFPLMGNQITEVDYGTFLRRVESGVVEKVEITDTEIGFIVKDSDKAYVTGRIHDPNLADRLYQAEVEFWSVIPQEMSPLLSLLLSWVIPIGIIILLGRLFASKFQKMMGGSITSLMGGRAAEALALNTVTSGAANDIEQATKLARTMVTRFGMSDEFGMMSLETVNNPYLGGETSLLVSSVTASRIDSVVLSVIKDAYQRAMDILEENKAKLHQLAQHLLENETISGEEFTSLLST